MSLDRPTFPMVRFMESYDAEEVDLAVGMVLENLALPRPRIDRGDIERLRFTPVRMRPGYAMGAVDDWFDQVVAELAQRGGEVQPTDATTRPTPTTGVIEDVDADSAWARVLAMTALVVVVAVLFYVSFS